MELVTRAEPAVQVARRDQAVLVARVELETRTEQAEQAARVRWNRISPQQCSWSGPHTQNGNRHF